MRYSPFGSYLQQVKNHNRVGDVCSYEKCPLFSSCPQMTFGGSLYSKTKARVFFVFDAPDQEEVQNCFPMVSSAGIYFREHWLNPFVAAAGAIPYLCLYLIRSPLLKDDGKSREATQTELEYCWEHFYKCLMEHKPEVIICMGGSIFSQFYRKAKNKENLPRFENHSIVKLRGNVFEVQFEETYTAKVFVGYSASFILRSPASFRYFEEDRDKVISYFCPNKKVKEKPKLIIKDISVINSVKDALDIIDFLTRGLPKNELFDLAFDTETENLNRVFNNKFLSWQFSWREGYAVVIPIEHPSRPLFADIKDKVKLIEAFQKLLNSSPEESRIAWIIFHNAKFDLSVLYGLYKIIPKGTIPIWDTLLGLHWLDENLKIGSLEGKPYSLKTLGKTLFNFSYKSSHLEARADGDLVSLSLDELVDYAGTDTILTLAVKKAQIREALAQPNNALEKLERFMRFYYSPASRAIALMECNGIFTSKEQLNYLQGSDSPVWSRIDRIENIDLQESPEVKVFRQEQKRLLRGEADISYEDDLWGDDDLSSDLPFFNPNKKDQEKAFYLDYLKLRPLAFSKKTKQPTLNKDFLIHYAEPETFLSLATIKPFLKHYKNPINENDDGDAVFPKNPLQLILEYRELSKLGNTYLKNIAEMVDDTGGDSIDNRIRASYWLAGTDTGRLSSSNPNLQNLPSGRSKIAKEIKNIFQAEPPSKRWPEGTALIQLDYKTAEVRWAAIFANDKNLIRLFNEARDSLMKACAPDSNITDAEFAETQLASDIHRRTASLMYGVEPKNVSKEMRQASKCLVGSTLLYTSKGIIPISSLVENTDDDVWLQRVNDTYISSFNGVSEIVAVNHKWVDTTIKVETKTGIFIQGDPEHKLLIWDNCQIKEKALRDISDTDFLIVPRNNKVWVSASPTIEYSVENEISESELEKTVSCAICGEKKGNLLNHIKHAHLMDIEEYQHQYPNSKLVSPVQIAKRMKSLLGTPYNVMVPKYPKVMSTSLAKLLGYLVAEGDGQRYTMSGNCYKSREMLKDFLACFFDCFGIDLSISEYPHITSTGVIRIPLKIVRYLLKVGLIQGYSRTQRVPEIIFRSTRDEIISFLCGYFEGEASIKMNALVVMSASPMLMEDIQQLLLSLNIVSKFFTEQKRTPIGKQLRTYYGLILSIRDTRYLRDIISFASTKKQQQICKIKNTSGQDVIYGLEKLLRDLKTKYRTGKGGYHRYAIDGVPVRFGERLSKLGNVEYTFERLASRPYVLDALRIWSEKENNFVFESIDWLFTQKAYLLPITKKIEINKRQKVYDIEVKDTSHSFIANGVMSKNCITFGILYGMGVKTLAANNGWSEEEAQQKIDMFFSAFPELKCWLEMIQKKTKELGYVETIMGRRRRLQFLYQTKVFREEAKANRLSMNAPIQGQSSDGGTIGMFSFLQFLFDNNLERRWLIQNVVHDSCLVQVPIPDLENACVVMQHYFVLEMANYIKKHFGFALPLPIECEIEIGLKYGDLHKWDGRPASLTKLIQKIKEDAQALWYTKREKPNKPKDLDLVFWDKK